MKGTITLTLILLCWYTPLRTSAVSKGEPTTSVYQGIYTYGNANGTSAYGSIIVYPETDSTILIYLYVNSGEPGFHVSELYQRLKIVDATAVYAPANTDCSLNLKFTSAALTISIISDNANHCSLGDGLASDYKRISNEKKEFFKDRNGKKIYFQKNRP